MGLVNTVVPLERLEEETVAVVPRDARPLPLRAAPAQGELPRRTRTATPASSSSPTTPTSSSTPATRRRRAARPTRRSARPTSRSSRSAARERAPMRTIWLMAARLRTLPAAVAPVLVGTALAPRDGDASTPLRVRRRAARRAVHPGRDEPLQRLLRRAPRRRHRGPPRPGARHRRRPRPAAPGADRDLRHLRRSPCSCGVYLIVVAGWELLVVGVAVDPRRRPLHRRPAPLRLRGPRRGLRLPLLRRRRRDRLLLRADRAAGRGRRSRSPSRSACSPPRSSSSTTSATSTPTARAGKRTLAVRLGRAAGARHVRGDGLPRVPDRAADAVGRSAPTCRRGCCCRWLALPLAVPLVRTVRNHADGPDAQRRARRRRDARSSSSASCSPPGSC